MNIAEVRQKFPQYSDLSDDQLAQALHQKFYADIPFADFSEKIGLRPQVDQSVMDANDARAQKPVEQSLASSMRSSIPGRLFHGIMDPIDAGAQMLAHTFGSDTESKRVDAINKEREQLFAQSRAEAGQGGVDVPRAIGSAALTYLGTRGLGAPTTLGGAAVQGAGYGLFQPVNDGGDFALEKAKQAGIGAALGPVGQVVGSGISKVIKPNTSAEAQSLLDRGVNLTPGQILGGAYRSAEEKAKSLPFIGGMIGNAERRANESLNTVAWNRVLSNIDQKLPQGMKGNEAVAHVEEAISSNYGKILDRIGAKPIDGALVGDLSNLGGMVAIMRKDVGDQYQAIIKQQIVGRLQNGKYLTGDAVKAAESKLGELASKDRELGPALFEARSALRDWLTRVAPEEARALSANNKAYAEFIRPLKASAALGADEGVFSAAQLQNAVKAADRSKDKRAFAKGAALMQDLSAPAKSVMGNRVPDSGTAGRGLAATAPFALGGLVASMEPTTAVLSGAGAAGLASIYTPAGQRAMQYVLSRRPEAAGLLAQGIRDVSPLLGAPLLPASYGLLNQ